MTPKRKRKSMVRELLDMQKVNGKTLESVLGVVNSIDETVKGYSRRMDEIERRLDVIERDRLRAATPPPPLEGVTQ